MGGQPPLTAIVTWLVRLLVPDGSQLRLQQGMFAWGAAIIAILIALAVCATAAAVPQGPWVAAHVALSPVLITVSLISFDALAVALVAGGLLAWYRGRYALSGLALMAALLARPTLGVVLLACLLLAMQRRRSALTGLLTGSISALAVVLGLAAVWGNHPFESFSAWQSQPASYGSLWFILGFAGMKFSTTTLTVIAFIGWVGAAGLAALLIRSDSTLGPAPVALLMLVVVIVTSRAVPVQAALWVLPLVALCAVRWRDHLIWASVELTYFALLWTFVARESNLAKALPQGWYAALTGARIIAWFFLVRAGLLTSSDFQPDAAPRFRKQLRTGSERRPAASADTD